MAVDINTTLENIKTSQDTLSGELTALTEALDQLTLALINAVEDCCKAQAAAGTSDIDPPPSDGAVSVGTPGDQFGSQEEYLDAKCLASNAIFDTYREIASILHTENVQDLLNIGAGVTGALFTLLVVAGPVAWAIVGIGGALLSMGISIISASLNFENVRDALDNKKDDLIDDLYQSSDTASAKADFLATLATATPTLTAPELKFVGFLLTFKSLNQLFSPGSEVLNYTPPSPTVCTTALWTVAQGNPTTPLSGTSITVNSAWGSLSPFVPDHHGTFIYIPPGLGDRTVDITSLSGWTTNPYGFPTLSDSGYINESGDWTPADGNPTLHIDDVCVQDGQYVDVTSSTPFTVTIEYKAACP